MYNSQNKETYFERLKINLVNNPTLHVPAKQLGFCTHFYSQVHTIGPTCIFH